MSAENILLREFEGKNMRDVFGETLAKMGDIFSDLVVLGSDAVESTRCDLFADKYPERTFNFGIAEQEMVSAAAGFALAGKMPLAATFGFLISMRACEQVRTDICYPNLNVKLAATHTGLSFGPGGTTHHSTEDIAIMRSFANMTIVSPADGYELSKAMKAVFLYEGPIYLRVGRGPVPTVFHEDFEFRIGKAAILREGTDITLIAYGSMVSEALGAAELLSQESVQARVINMSTIKPLDEEAVIKAARETGAIVTVEEHNMIGGLGEAVAACTSMKNPVLVERIGIPDTYCGIGTDVELRAKFGMTAKDIFKVAKRVLHLKSKLSIHS